MFVLPTELELSYSAPDLPPTTIKNEVLSDSESSFSGKQPVLHKLIYISAIVSTKKMLQHHGASLS